MIDFLVSISNIFIDDILTWKDEVYLGALGGAGLHALAGCHVWQNQLGIVACVGEDFQSCLPKLHAMGIDTAGIQYNQEKTNRQWQIIQPGEVRVGVFRDPRISFRQAVPDFDHLPPQYASAAGYHILWQGEEHEILALLEDLHRHNPRGIIVYEPSIIDKQWGRAFYRRLFPFIDAFSPGLSESREILKMDEPERIVQEFLAMGCRMVALRLGHQGSLVGDTTGQLYRVPAAEAKVVDVTGAGNAYCGGLLCGLAARKPIRECLAMASVSASFEIEQFGLCCFLDEMISIRDAKFTQVLKGIN